MTTFTSDDREEAYKKILAAAPNQPGYEDAVPIPFAGWINTAPPHVVDSGASVMDKPTAWIREDGVIAFHKKSEVDSQGFKWYALYTHPVKELTDEEILDVANEFPFIENGIERCKFARAILRKAQEK